jgi:Cu(I)/Ag(I) efflux system membrane fusion protein
VVYVKTPGREAFELRDVVLGPRAGEFFIVESGLREGERVVTKGAFKIDSDLQIKGQRSMMNPEPGREVTGHEGHH